MIKRVFALAIVAIFILTVATAYGAKVPVPTTAARPLDKTKDRLSKGMDNLLYGPTEVPDNLSETKSKGTKLEGYTEKTRTGVERGIGRFFTGVWQLATFWYSDPGYNKSSSASSGKTK